MASPDTALATRYQHKTDIEHVLDNPDTYTGSMTLAPWEAYVMNADCEVVKRSIQMIPGLLKLVDEGLVNSRDHFVRMASKGSSDPVTKIEVAFHPDHSISIKNDGEGIDVAKHPDLGIWIPEMIFGRLRTSTNYDKSQNQIVGGKNGFGFKLVLIWSVWGEVTTFDATRSKLYKQRFADNLSEIHDPVITTKRGKRGYTEVHFMPDYKRLGISGLDQDVRDLLARRVYDLAAVTDKSVRVRLNGEWLPVRNFQQYINLYPALRQDGTAKAYESPDPRWEYAVCLSPEGEFDQVSFVNGICTPKGGKHVDYIMGQVVRKLTALIKKRKKVEVKSSTIRELLYLFLRCDIVNPSFDSQTKEYLTTQSSQFGSKCTVSDKFIEKVARMGVIETACSLTEVKDVKASKKTDGTKAKSIRGIPKLIDAHKAGTKDSSKCTLILCEGDSAKAGIVSGLSKTDRETIGVYPMRGKLFNVRGEGAKRINANQEISDIKKILGLSAGKEYSKSDVESMLRYGQVLFMTDQDLDGSHIKGLAINLFEAQWPSLLKVEGFLGFMNTPILKARKGAKTLVFYNEGEWRTWLEANDPKGWSVKYYKGLGTSTAKEFKDYFAAKKVVTFSEHPGDVDSLDMAFNKKRSSDRKSWLEGYDRDLFLDTSLASVSYGDFIHKELVHFSKYDCDRSIPNLMDGLKTSQRKILYVGMKRQLTKSIKVAQFSGSVSELSCYHHGEASLNGAIKGLAHDFVGSNNINLLIPDGQFGTRMEGGGDAASERYIFTRLSPLVEKLFPTTDDVALTFLEDDGTRVEPLWYAPIIPMVLVNGCKGIGTGFSTEVLPHNPVDVLNSVLDRLQGRAPKALVPWYRGFTGTVEPVPGANKVIIRGVWTREGKDSVRISELPIGTWTGDYKAILETLIESGQIKGYKDMSTDRAVDITVSFGKGNLGGLSDAKIVKLLRMEVSKSTNNMHLFNQEEHLVKFDTTSAIIDAYIAVRLDVYRVRREKQLAVLANEVARCRERARYIGLVLDGEIDLRRKKGPEIVALMAEHGFDKPEDHGRLTKMPMDSVSDANVRRYTKEMKAREQELIALRAHTPTTLWVGELEELKKSLS